MTATEQIIEAYRRGRKPRLIAADVGISVRQVQRILLPHRPAVTRQANGDANQIESLRPYILFLMKQEGRDFTHCELCADEIPEGKFYLHHTKYQGATYYDRKIVCCSCNLSRENMYLT